MYGFTNWPRKRIWTTAKPRPTKSGCFMLDCVSITIYKEFGQNIPFSLRGRISFTFLIFDLGKKSIDENIGVRKSLYLKFHEAIL